MATDAKAIQSLATVLYFVADGSLSSFSAVRRASSAARSVALSVRMAPKMVATCSVLVLVAGVGESNAGMSRVRMAQRWRSSWASSTIGGKAVGRSPMCVAGSATLRDFEVEATRSQASKGAQLAWLLSAAMAVESVVQASRRDSDLPSTRGTYFHGTGKRRRVTTCSELAAVAAKAGRMSTAWSAAQAASILAWLRTRCASVREKMESGVSTVWMK